MPFHPQPAWIRNGDRTEKPLSWPGAVLHHRAVHEAGHAAVHLHIGRPINRIWIAPDTSYGPGHSGEVEPVSPEWTWGCEAAAALFAAGERAANYWLHINGRWSRDTAWAIERGADGDRTYLAAAAPALGAPARSEHDQWEWACRAADAVLLGRWGLVGALADALLASPRLCLERRQIEEIATRAN